MPIDLRILESDLRSKVAASKKKIELLETIKARGNRLATPEEKEELARLQLEALDPEVIALILDAKAQRRDKKRTFDDTVDEYKPFLVGDMLAQAELKFKLEKALEADSAFRFDFILHSGVHCSPVQISYNPPEDVNLFYIDAAGDPSNVKYLNDLVGVIRKFKAIKFYVFEAGGLQKDTTSCSIFSVQHLNNLSTHTDSEKKSIGAKKGAEALPKEMASVFLKNAQSLSSLQPEHLASSVKKVTKPPLIVYFK